MRGKRWINSGFAFLKDMARFCSLRRSLLPLQLMVDPEVSLDAARCQEANLALTTTYVQGLQHNMLGAFW